MATPSPRTRRSSRRLRTFAVAGMLAILGMLGVAAASPASAHATLSSTDPTEGAVVPSSPGTVTFTFDETVHTTSDSVRMFDAQGEPVTASASSRDNVLSADVPDELADGTYVIAWRVISADGHPVAGSLSFSVGQPSLTVAAPDLSATTAQPGRTALSIVQVVDYVALFVAGGLTFFMVWCLRGIGVSDDVRRRLDVVRRASTGVAVLTAAALVPFTGAYQAGVSVTDLDAAFDWSLLHDEVLVFALQSAGLIAALLLRRLPVEAVCAAAVAVASPALVGHTRAYEPLALLMAADLTHVFAGAIWLGGLLGLLLTLRPLSGRPRDAAALLARFSLLGSVVLGAVAASGAVLAWRVLGSWGGFVHTGYGRVLLVKIGLVACVAAVAGLNHYLLVPRVAGATGHDAQRRGAGLVRRAVAVEGAGLAVVLGLTGFLVNLSPREAPSQRQPVASRVVVAEAGSDKVLATMAPGRIGPNVVTVQVQDETGEPVTTYQAPVVSVHSASVDLGEVPARPIANGTYAADVVVPTAGVWTVQVSLRTSEFDNPVASVDITVR